jgi:small GTP-binding protein
MSAKRNFKLVLLGDTSVGKTSISMRFVRDDFNEFQEPTIGAAFLTKTLNRGERRVCFDMWDTAGQERYNSLAPMYYRGSKAAVIVYDVTNKRSFAGAKRWVEELYKSANNIEVIALVGNKADLTPVSVATKEAAAYAKQKQLLFFEVSAKSGKNVQKLFSGIADQLHDGDPYEELPLHSPQSRIGQKCC